MLQASEDYGRMVAEMEKNEHAFDVNAPGERPQYLQSPGILLWHFRSMCTEAIQGRVSIDTLYQSVPGQHLI